MKPTIDMMVSPYDRGAAQPAPGGLIKLAYKPKQRWVPSRFNARTVGNDGRLLLWNTLSGAVSAFATRDTERVLGHLTPSGTTSPLDKASEYMVRRGYLVKEGTDEMGQFRYKYAQQQWRTDTLQFILLASEDCNFRCVYCYEKFQRGTMEPQVRQGIMALTMARASQLKAMSVGWFGGEPLYGWEAVEELSPFFKDVADRHGILHEQNMTTNGYLLTEERATKLLDWGCKDFQITVDGLPEEHDCKRVGRDGSPTQRVILDNLRSLRQRKQAFQVALRVNFDQKNIPRMGAFLESLSEDFGSDPRFQLRFRAVGKWGGANDEQLSTCGVSEQRSVISEVRDTAERLSLAQEAGIRTSAFPGSQVCYAARPYNFIVGADGKLMKCTVALDDMEDNIVGHIKPDGTLDLIEERMSKWVIPHFETDSHCQKCYVLPTCQGAQCPLTRVARNERTCCSIKSELKSEMRFTLSEAEKERETVGV